LELVDGQTVYRTIIERYSRNPRGWRFTISPSGAHGFYDAFVSNEEDSWHLKLDTIFKPSPIVIGAKAELELSRLNAVSPVQFGYRPLDPALLAQLLSGQDDSLKLSGLLSSIEPVVPEMGGNYAQGPFVLTNRPALHLAGRQQQLDEKLSSELLKLVRAKYPSYG
jgi:hypothetical protein